MYSLSEEEKAVLLLTHPSLVKDKIDSCEISDGPMLNDVDNEKIYEISTRNGVASILYKANNKANLTREPLSDNFKDLYFPISIRNVQLLFETINVNNILSRQKIDVISLKGAIASELLFEDLGVYPSSDIDILVHPSALDRAIDCLCEEGGYDKIEEIQESDLLSSHYHVILAKGDICLEVHWNLVKRYFCISPDFWWKDVHHSRVEDTLITELSVEKYIIYLIFRLFDHGFYPLKFFVLLGVLLDKNKDNIDWIKLIRYASRYKMRKLVVFTIRLMDELYPNIINSNITKKNIIFFYFYKNIILNGLFKGISRPYLRMMIFSLLLDKKSQIVRILVGRIFPPKSEIRLRYRLDADSPMVYIYYILNPFFLLRK